MYIALCENAPLVRPSWSNAIPPIGNMLLDAAYGAEHGEVGG